MINNKDEKFLGVAKAVADTSEFRRIKIGACVADKHRILSVGCNNPKSHPIQKKYNRYRVGYGDKFKHYIHAETQAIVNAPCDLEGATIYVYRDDRNGNISMCKPCNACMRLIRDMGVKRVVYTSYDGIEEMFL